MKITMIYIRKNPCFDSATYYGLFIMLHATGISAFMTFTIVALYLHTEAKLL